MQNNKRRVIKFRAKALTGELVFFDLHESEMSGDSEVFYVRGIPCEVGTEEQFAGLLDKNGKENYEGDRVSASVWGAVGYNYDKFVIDFIDGCFCAVQKRKPLNFTCLHKTDDREVIGHIYKKRKLLNDQ